MNESTSIITELISKSKDCPTKLCREVSVIGAKKKSLKRNYHQVISAILLSTSPLLFSFSMPSAAADWLLDNTTTNVNTVIAPGTWNNVRIGTNNAATLNIISGGELNNQSASIGYFASGVGEVFVTGPTAVWNNTSVLDIGYYGDGTLTVTSR